MNSIPRVSVVIPVFNSEKYIESAIESVLRQTEKNIELIVVDDCSSDSSWKIIQKKAEADKRARLFRNTVNKGVAETRNTGLNHCRGELIAFLDGDDYWFPQKLEKQLLLQEKTDADLVYCSYQIVDTQGRKVCNDFIVTPTTDLKSTLGESMISCSTALIRSSFAKKCAFNENYYHEDFVYWIDLLKMGAVAVGEQSVLAAYRITPKSRASNKVRNAINRYRIIRHYAGCGSVESVKIIGLYGIKALKKYRKMKK